MKKLDMTKQQMLYGTHQDIPRNDVALVMKRNPEPTERGFSKGTARLLERVRSRYTKTSAGQILTGTEASR